MYYRLGLAERSQMSRDEGAMIGLEWAYARLRGRAAPDTADE
jgi:hypothetical protein